MFQEHDLRMNPTDPSNPHPDAWRADPTIPPVPDAPAPAAEYGRPGRASSPDTRADELFTDP